MSAEVVLWDGAERNGDDEAASQGEHAICSVPRHLFTAHWAHSFHYFQRHFENLLIIFLKPTLKIITPTSFDQHTCIFISQVFARHMH